MAEERATKDGEAVSGERTFPLRPGVAFPDFRAVRSPAARDALATILRLFGFEERMNGYGEAEDRVRRAILRLYRETGRAPTVLRLAERAGMEPDDVKARLAALRGIDLVTLGTDGGATGAYPVTDRETGHRVRIGGRALNAMCAVDALGVGAMYGEDAAIESACHACGAPIRIATRDKGQRVASASPASTMVWAGAVYEGEAARSLCCAIVFFCSTGHLASWRARNREAKGVALTVEEALEVGRALFGPTLLPGAGA